MEIIQSTVGKPETLDADLNAKARFNDRLVAALSQVPFETLRKQVTQVFVMLFNRVPDAGTIDLWASRINANVTIGDVAQAMLTSEVDGELYDASWTSEDIIWQFYDGALGRAPDSEGLAYWSSRLDSVPADQRGTVIAEFVNAIATYNGSQAADLTSRDLFNNKVTASLAYGVALQGTDRTIERSLFDVVTAADVSAALAAAANSVNLPPDSDAYVQTFSTSDPEAVITARPALKQKLDRWGNVVEITDPRSDTWVTRYRYNANNQVVEQVKPNDEGLADVNEGSAQIRNYYDEIGRLVGTRDANGNVNSVRYDLNGNLSEEIHADGGRVRYGTDAFGQRVTRQQSNGTLTAYAYDHRGNLTSATTGKVAVYRVEGDATGDPFRSMVNLRTVLVSGQADIVERYEYDELGRRTSAINGAGETTHTRYDLRGNVIGVTDAMGHTIRTAYSTFGHKVEQLDANGNRMTWKTDAFGRVYRHTDLAGTNVFYGYNLLGQLTTQTSGGHTYSEVNRAPGQNLEFIYDGNLLTTIFDYATGRVTRYTYDLAGNRIAEVTEVRVDPTSTDEAAPMMKVQNNRLVYDSQGRIKSIDDGRYHVEYEYDANGNRTHVLTRYVDDSGQQVTIDAWNEYDAMNRQTVVDGVKDAQGDIGISTTQGHRIAYDAAGNRISDTYGGVRAVGTPTGALPAGNNDNGYYYVGEDGQFTDVQPIVTSWSTESGGFTTETYAYDAANRLVSIKRDGLEIDRREYDAAGRVVSSGTVGNAGSRDFRETAFNELHVAHERRINQYDEAGRQHNQTVRNAYGQSVADVATDYDGVGNVTRNAVYVLTGGGHEKSYYYGYALDEGYKEEVVIGKVTRNGEDLSEARTYSEYDANGALVRVRNRDEAGNTRIRTLHSDASSRVLQRTEDGVRTHVLIANGEMIGQSSDGNTAGSFSASYVPASADSLKAAPTAYTVQEGDTLKGIAKAVWGDASLWYLIADANGVTSLDGMEGQVIKLPTRANTIHNDFGMFKPYSAASAVGDTTPALVTPPPVADRGGCGGFGAIIVAVVMIAVAAITQQYYLAELGVELAGPTLTGAPLYSVGSQVAASVVGATVGNVAGQVVANAIGQQDGFSWRQVATAALSAGFSSGVNMPGIGNEIVDTAVRGAVNSGINQGINIVVGLQDRFSWRAVAASAIAAPIAGKVGQHSAEAVGRTVSAEFGSAAGKMASSIAGRFAYGVTSQVVVAQASGGRLSAAAIAADAFGNALGNSIAYGDWGDGQQTAELKAAAVSQSSGSNGAGLGMGAGGPGQIDSHALELARLDGQAAAELALHGALDQVPARAISMGEVGPSLIDASLYEIGEEPGKNGRNGLIWNTWAVSYGVDLSSPQSRQLSANELGPVIVGGARQWPVGSEGWQRQQESAQALQQPMFAPDDLIGAPIKLGAKGIVAGAGALFGTMKNVGSKEIGVLLRQGSEIAPRSVVADEVAALQRIGANSSVGSSSAERLARISELSEANAARQLDRLQSEARAINPNAHFFDRHGFNTTLEEQYIRAGTGLTPYGVQQNFLVDSSRFLTARDQLAAIQRAESINLLTGQSVVNVNMGSIVGEGFTALRPNGTGLDYLLTTNVRTVFKNGAVYTQFPSLRP